MADTLTDTDKFDLLHFAESCFRGEEPVMVAGQRAQITRLSKSLDDSDVFTLTLEIRPLR